MLWTPPVRRRAHHHFPGRPRVHGCTPTVGFGHPDSRPVAVLGNAWHPANCIRLIGGRIMPAAARRTRHVPSAKVTDETVVTTFSSDLLTPEEERELLTSFWDCKNELVRVLLRHFPDLRAVRPPLEPWPMAQFIRDNCTERTREVLAVGSSQSSRRPAGLSAPSARPEMPRPAATSGRMQ